MIKISKSSLLPVLILCVAIAVCAFIINVKTPQVTFAQEKTQGGLACLGAPDPHAGDPCGQDSECAGSSGLVCQGGDNTCHSGSGTCQLPGAGGGGHDGGGGSDEINPGDGGGATGIGGIGPGQNGPPACVGTLDAHATMCINDSNPPVDTDVTLAMSCHPVSGGSPYCESTCNAGYTPSGNICVPIVVSEVGNVYGWAFSSNIGWIKLNCAKDANIDGLADHACDGTNGTDSRAYGVRINNTNNDNASNVPAGPGTMSGHAWSNSIGWVDFGPSSGFPSGSGTDAVKAELLANNNFRGWAKAILGDSSDDGWNGWISLSGTNYASGPVTDPLRGVTYNPLSAHIVGYAWAGDVLGWVNFWNVTYGVPSGTFAYHMNAVPPSINIVRPYGGGAASGNTIVNINLDSGTPSPVTLSVSMDPPSSSGVGAKSKIGSKILAFIHSKIAQAAGRAPSPSIDTTPCTLSNPDPICTRTLTINAASSIPNGTYTAYVTGTATGGVPAPQTISIPVNLSTDSSPPSPAFSVTCSATGAPYLVNKPVTWNSNITGGTAPFTYVWSGTDGLTGSSASVVKIYTTVGVKTATVSVTDSLGANAACSPGATITIGVTPVFKEI